MSSCSAWHSAPPRCPADPPAKRVRSNGTGRGPDNTEVSAWQLSFPGLFLFVCCAMFCLFNGPTLGIWTSDSFHLSYLDSTLDLLNFGVFLLLLDTTGPDSRALTVIPVFLMIFFFILTLVNYWAHVHLHLQVGVKSLWKSDDNAYSQNKQNMVYYKNPGLREGVIVIPRSSCFLRTMCCTPLSWGEHAWRTGGQGALSRLTTTWRWRKCQKHETVDTRKWKTQNI